MKIIKHAREMASTSSATGQLLGLDSQGLLNVSDVFPLPSGSLGSGGEGGEEGRGSKAAARYTSTIMPRLAALGSDANIVGFYVSTTNGQHLANPGFLDTLTALQLGAPALKAAKGVNAGPGGPSKPFHGGKGVAIVCDLASSSQGTVNLKAFRLSTAFVDAYQVGRFDSQSLIHAKLTPSNILEEVPLYIQSSALLTAFLSTIASPLTASFNTATSSAPYAHPKTRSPPLPSTPFASLGLPSSSDPEGPVSLASTLSALLTSMDTHNTALSTLSFQARQLGRDRTRLEAVVAKRKAENEVRAQQGLPPLPPSAEEAALQEPSRLETMCALTGVEGAAKALSEVSGTGLVRAYGAKAGVAV